MSWMGKSAAAIAVAGMALIWAGTAEAQSAKACKAQCSTTYSACQRRAINADTCLRRWHVCKKKCSPAAARPMSPAPAAKK